MNRPADIYKPSLSLLTDLYEITMAFGYWKSGRGDREAVFNLFFRHNPFGGGFTVACGLEAVIGYLERFRFEADDLAYLAGLTGTDGRALFDPAFLEYLGGLRLTCDVDAVPEGTVVFPQEPLLRVRGPIMQCQLLETPLLTLINFQTLIATKSARVCHAARGDPVLEFGLRRAQGVDGGLSASRAAFIGGCAGTSNVLAGRLFGIPVKGTHAHSWVMTFDTESEAFEAWAKAMPNNCIFLVDTFDSLDGVRHAVEVGRRLRARGVNLAGIRLDSGDLAYLSIEARRILDEAGFTGTAILASNDLDEHLIASLKDQGAAISAWGVGTKLVTGFDQPALGGVYKLAAIREPDGSWRYPIKLSEQRLKITTPGHLQVRRFTAPDGLFAADAIFDELGPIPDDGQWVIVDPLDDTRRKRIEAGTPGEDLLVPVLRAGRLVYDPPPLSAVRGRLKEQLARLHPSIKRFENPHEYPAGLELGLSERKTRLILEARASRGG
ncbi:MAG: nicotinate phosphoribosyltransferase [Candidatus Sumerlaeia bacterium]